MIEAVAAEATYDLRHRVLGRGHTPADLAADDDLDPDSGHFAIELDGMVVAVGTVRRRPLLAAADADADADADITVNGWQVRGMAVEPARRGAGLGSAILAAIVEHVARRGGGVLWCHARLAARTLYGRHGFVARGEPFDDVVAGPQVMMTRVVAPHPFEAHRATVGSVVAAYRPLGSLRFAYVQGSIVEGLATEADLDVVLVWSKVSPSVATRLPRGLTDLDPAPTSFALPGFDLDRFHVDGQQVDVKHVTVDEVDGWWSAVEAGGGASGYPMPAIALHGLTSGELVHDPGGDGAERVRRFGAIPRRFVDGAVARAEQALAAYMDELHRCVDRGDALLLHDQLVQLERTLFVAWFARGGRWWPHEKRLARRLEREGRRDLVELEQAVWHGELADRVGAIGRLAGALSA